MSDDLRGKRVVVTGASRGIGRAIASACLERGMRVVGVARNFPADAPPGLVQVRADLADPKSRERVVPEALDALSGFDAWVNNAGIVRYGPLLQATPEEEALQWEVNHWAPLGLLRAAMPHLEATRGSVVNVVSTLALRPAEATGVYSATKAALLAATKVLALEHAHAGVRVNAVAPGVIDTDMIRGPRPGGESPEAHRETLASLHLLGRLGTPEDVAGAVLHLLASPWTTGTVLPVDGGLLAT